MASWPEDGTSRATAIWDTEWRSVYNLAEAIMKRTLEEVAGPMP